MLPVNYSARPPSAQQLSRMHAIKLLCHYVLVVCYYFYYYHHPAFCHIDFKYFALAHARTFSTCNALSRPGMQNLWIRLKLSVRCAGFVNAKDTQAV